MQRWGIVLLLGCSSASAGLNLRVDVRGDVVPGVDFTGTRATLRSESEDIVASADRLSGDVDIESGFRAATFSGLAAGAYILELELHDPAVVLRRRIALELRDDLGFTVTLSRRCLGVVCAAGETCVAGRCRDETCSSQRPQSCEAECASAAECAEDAGACGWTCEEGQCLADVAASSCGEAAWCHPSAGCVPRVAPSPL